MQKKKTADRCLYDAEVGRRLEEARKARRISRQELGEIVGLTREALGGIERGATGLHPYLARQLATILDVEPCWLLFGLQREVVMPPPAPSEPLTPLAQATRELEARRPELAQRVIGFIQALLLTIPLLMGPIAGAENLQASLHNANGRTRRRRNRWRKLAITRPFLAKRNSGKVLIIPRNCAVRAEGG